MNKNKFLAIFIVFFILLIGCSKDPSISPYNDEKKISSSSNTYSVEYDVQNLEGTELNGVIKKMDGMDTIWTYDCENNLDITMTSTLKVTTGKVKLVLIYPDNSLETIVESTTDATPINKEENTLHLKKGTNRIKVVADENTSFEFDIQIPKGKFEKLGK